LIGIEDSLTPHSIHIHEVDAFSGISRGDMGRLSNGDSPEAMPAMIRELRPGCGALISRSRMTS
jgi:hypothetical protein